MCDRYTMVQQCLPHMSYLTSRSSRFSSVISCSTLIICTELLCATLRWRWLCAACMNKVQLHSINFLRHICAKLTASTSNHVHDHATVHYYSWPYHLISNINKDGNLETEYNHVLHKRNFEDAHKLHILHNE